MSKDIIFEGIATALVTPMKSNFEVDFESLGKLIDWQIDEGINGIVICGTTGEASTLNDDEHKECIRFAVERAAGRVPIIAGTGSNDTAHGQQLTEYACKVGADACLVVTPYYNKVTQDGLVRMYDAYAESSTVPIIVYNVPGRTGVNILPETYERLAENDKLVAIKEANNNIASVTDTLARVQGKMNMYSGNDDQIVPIMSVGGIGCISVLSNILPKETVEMAARFLAGDVKGAAELQLKYRPLVASLFCEVNPIPAKAAVAALGFCENVVRAPLYPMSEKNYERLINDMRAVGLNV